MVLTERLNRFLAFDQASGSLRAEAGATLLKILETFVPRGWFLPVTPGTRHISLGGCVAADVHGKNHHHDGSFGNFIESLELLTADGGRRRCSPEREPELFWATVGGMGLTGMISEVTIRLMPVETAYLSVQHHVASGLDALLDLFEDSAVDDRYSVAWLDCLARGPGFGRGIYLRGHHATLDELGGARARPLAAPVRRTLAIPCHPPAQLLNRASIAAFNSLYFRRGGAKREPYIQDYVRYFYPLDALGHWNRLYGKPGFYQYQCVIPNQGARRGLAELLERLARGRAAPFLAVLKRLGPAGRGLLSFPMDGYTLALDVPRRSPRTEAILDELDAIVIEHGGRVYLAKDARLGRDAFRAMYPGHREWLAVKTAIDPDYRFGSDLSRRLGLADP